MIGVVVGTLLQAMLPLQLSWRAATAECSNPGKSGSARSTSGGTSGRNTEPARSRTLISRSRWSSGVFSGSRPTTGCRVEIVSISHVGGVVVVEYRERTPAPDALVAQMLTSPFHLVSVPRKSGVFRFKRLVPPG